MKLLLCLFVFAGLFVPSPFVVLPSLPPFRLMQQQEAQTNTFRQKHRKTENSTENWVSLRLKERELNKQNSGNVNKNRMRERARHNKHTHTPEKINIGETVDLKTHTYYLSIYKKKFLFFPPKIKKRKRNPAAQKNPSQKRGSSEGSVLSPISLLTEKTCCCPFTTENAGTDQEVSDACFW